MRLMKCQIGVVRHATYSPSSRMSRKGPRGEVRETEWTMEFLEEERGIDEREIEWQQPTFGSTVQTAKLGNLIIRP